MAVKILTLLGINKILALHLGPAGYAVVGQFQNAVQMISTIASGAINTGVIKYTAEYNEDEIRQRIVWQTAGSIAMVGSIALSILVFIFRSDLALWFLKDKTMAPVFGWFAASLFPLTLNTLLLAIINGKKDIFSHVVVNISGSIISLLAISAMLAQWSLMGALVGLAIYQSLSFFVTLALCVKKPWFRLSHLFGRIDKEVAKNLAKYTVMALTTAIVVPLTHLMIRNHLGKTLGWVDAGYWEAMWRLSSAYLMLITTSLSLYYIPRLSEIKNNAELHKEILSGYRTILPIAVVFASLVYILRYFIINLLFSPAFLSMDVLFFWQLIGDVLKIGGWLLAYVMISKSMTTAYVLTEIIFAFGFYFLIVIFIQSLGIKGAAVAHALTYALYWPILNFIVRKRSSP